MRRSVQKSIKYTAGMVLRKIQLLLFIPLGFFLLSTGIAFAKGGDVVWQHADPQAGKQDPSASVMDNDGNIIITGYQNVTGGMDDDYWTVKFRADNGGVAWRASFNKAGGTDRAAAVAAVVDANNDIVVTGFVWNGNNQDIHTIKYSGATGDIVWQHTYNGAASGNDTGTAVAVYDSYVYVGGNSQNANGHNDIVILKYHLNGTSPAAEVIYNGPANEADLLEAIAADATGFAVTGKSWNGSADDMLTIKYDLDGNKLWEARRSGAGGASGKQVKMGPGGTVIASGTAANGIDVDLYTAKYSSATGTVVWDRTYNGAYDDEPFGLAIDGAGDVYVTGYTWTLEGNNDFYTARYSGSTGAIIWEQQFDSGNGNTDMSIATGIVVDEGGDVFVTGFTVTDDNYDFQTLKYHRDTGNQLWQRSFNGADNRNERPVGIALTAGGEVVVSGWSETLATGMDYIVIKYDKGAINPPTSLNAATLADTSIRLNWTDNSSNESGFRIQRKTGVAGAWADIATVEANVTTYTDPAAGLAPGTYYYYRVLSFNAANGDSHYSNEAWGLTVYVNYILPSWSFLHNEANRDDFAIGIAVGSDDHPVVTGTVLTGEDEFNLNYNYLTMKLDRGDHHTIWGDLYDDEDSEYDAAKCIAVDKNDDIIVSGISSLYYVPASRNINSMFTLKYSPSGPPKEWGAQYNGTGAIDDRATAIATTADGANNIVIIGYGKNSSIPANDDIYVVKYNADGTRAWAAAQYDGGKGDQPRSVAVAPDGSVFVTGYSEKALGGYNFYTAKYHGTTGTRIWTDIYSVTSGGDNQGKSAAVDGSGDLYVTGYAIGASGTRDIHTIKYSGSGETPVKVWERTFDGLAHGDDAGVAVRVDPIDGAIVVAGTTRSGAGDNDFTVIRYSPDGTTLWERTLQKPQTDDLLVDMAIDASGYLYLAGSAGNGSADVLTLLYDHLGNFIGATSFDGATHDNDEADAVAVNYRGEAFIAGYSTNAAGNTDYLVVKQTNTRLLVPAPFAAASLPAHDKLDLNWRDNTPGATFTIERSMDSVNWAAVAALPAGTISYQDAGLAANTRYCYRITASKNGVSRPIGACATTTLPPPVLNPAEVISATAISLGWNNVSGNTGYKVERSTDGSSWSQMGGILAADATVYNDTGLTAGIVYYYRVSTVSPAGISTPSPVQVAPALNAVTVVSGTRIDLAWPGISGNTGYRIERSTDSANWVQIATPLQGATTYSDTTVTPGIVYSYRLTVVTSSGASGASLSQQGATPLTAPTLQSASGITTSQLTLTWNAVTGDTAGYAIWEQGCNYNNSSSDVDYCTISYGWAWGSWNQVGTTGPGVTTFTRTGLAAGNANNYYVAAKSTAGVTSPPSNVKLAWTVPAAPVLNPPSAPSDSAVVLIWSNVPGDNGYTIQRKVGAAGSYVDVKTQGKNVTTWTDTAVTASTTYFYRVRAAGITSSSEYSNEREITTPPVGPVVASVTAASSTTVTWNNVPGNIGYEIRRSYFNYCSRPDRAGNSSYASYWSEWTQLPATIAQNQTTFTDSNVLAGYNYKYSIRAILPEGSATGWGSDGGRFALTIPPVPGGLYLSGISSTQINANWGDVCGELNFGIQYKQRTGADCAAENWSTGVGSLSGIVMNNPATTSITGVNSSVPYCFQVRAYNGSGTSAWSTAATYLPPPDLAVPTNVAQTTLSLSWTNVAGNTGYRVERSTDNVNFSLVTNRTANITTYNDSGLSSGTIYYYRIKTLLGSTSSAPSNVRSVTMLAPTPPVLNPPTNITSSQMTLSWEEVSGNYGYKVEQSSNGTTWTQLATPAQGVVTYTATGLASGTLYYYRVSTKTASGSYTAPSNVQSATTLLPPPVVVLTMINEGSINLTWQLIYNATQYKVSRSIGTEGPWTQLSALVRPYTTSYCGYSYPTVGCPNLTADSTSFMDTGLTEDTQYCYQVTAWAANTGDSEQSAIVCMKTPAVGRPNLTATAENSMKIRLDWTYDPSTCTPTPCGSPDGFEVWKQAWNGEWALKGKVLSGTTYTDTSNIEPMKRYIYRIRAFRGSDVSSFSNEAGAKAPAYVSTDQPCVVP